MDHTFQLVLGSIFTGVYLNAVDRWGHSYGPNSEEVFDIVKQTDEAIKEMLLLLKTYNLEKNTNVVIFSDHGMTEISESRTIDISDHIGSVDVIAVEDKGAVCSIWPREGKIDKVSFFFNFNKVTITVVG